MNPADFSANIDNRRWPMTVGSRWVYKVTDLADGSTQRQVITVTRRTKLIADGVRARVVRDVVRDHGKPTEVTDDGTRRTRRATSGTSASDDLLRAREAQQQRLLGGRRGGALPGIALPAKPRVGLSYREEYSKGVAEDQSRVLALDAQAQAAPATTSTSCWPRTRRSSPTSRS